MFCSGSSLVSLSCGSNEEAIISHHIQSYLDITAAITELRSTVRVHWQSQANMSYLMAASSYTALLKGGLCDASLEQNILRRCSTSLFLQPLHG
jgi:hypothetical protein